MYFSLLTMFLSGLLQCAPSTLTNVYLNGVVYSVDKENPNWHTEPREALVIEDGIIKYVGSNNGTHAYIDRFKSDGKEFHVFDLHENTVLPGIHDVHMHPLEAGSAVEESCMLPVDKGPELMRNIILGCASNEVGTTWVLGFGYSIMSMLDHINNGGRNPRDILDEVIPDRPAVMVEETFHSAWVNSMALSAAGINESTGIRPGGVIMRDSSNRPNGILLENEVIEILDKVLKPSRVLDEYNYDGLLWSLGELAKAGITSICDAKVYWKRDHHKAWDRACFDNALTVRAVLGLWAYPSNDDASQIATLKSMYSHESPKCDNLLRKQQIKLYSDGVIESTTAAVLQPYLRNLNLPGLQDNVSMNYFNESRLEMYLGELQNFEEGKGFDFHIHTVGDRGVRESLNAIERTTHQGTRHRLTHVELVNNNDLPRFKELNVTADFQVASTFALPFYIPELELFVGTKAEDFIPVKSVIDAGGFTTFSSDWDVSTYNPFIGIQHATQRGSQSVDVKTAIEMYTINPAFVMRQEESVGSLVEGKEADLIVINKDVLNIQTQSINTTIVLQTLLQGQQIYRRTTGSHAGAIEDVTSEYTQSSGCNTVKVSSCLTVGFFASLWSYCSF